MSLDSITHIKVFPGIGTARVGNSPEYFIGPEFPGDVPNLGKPYKDQNGLLKPQAARFRVYGYDANNNVVAEITHDPDGGTTLQWDVHIRNLKAANYAFQGKFGFNPDQYRNPGVLPNTPGTDPNSRSSLIIDPKERSISGNNLTLANGNAIHLDGGKIFSGIGQAEIPTSLLKKGATGNTMVTYNEKEVSLGRLETDPGGRLIVVGGKGEAGCLIEPPIILQKGVATFVEGTNVLLGEAQPGGKSSGPSTTPFYTNKVTTKLLDQVSVFLSSKSDGTGEVYVDDQCIITVNGTQVYSHDFSNGNSGKVTSLPPVDITEAMKPFLGKEVEIEIQYIDLHGGSYSGSAFYLSYINDNPTSNGNSYFNNPGWYDDTGGGSVNATVTINGKTFSTNNETDLRGWVAVSPPKYVPTMNNVVSLLDLQLAMFPEEDPVSGTVNFAYLGANGIPYFSEKSITNFDPLSNLSPGDGNPSIVRYNGDDYMAYTNSSGEMFIAMSKDEGKTWTNNVFNAITPDKQKFTKTTSFAPSLCVFDGALTYVIVIEGGFLAIGSSTDGTTFTFELANPGSGVGPIAANSAPSAVPYNGRLYISYLGADNSVVIAHRYLQPSGRDYFYTFNGLDNQAYRGTSPALGVFFGELYCAYTGTDRNSYLGSYNNFSPAPAEPAKVSFDFNKVGGAPKTKQSPSIGSSHGKLYYALIDSNSNLYLAIAAPGLQNIHFSKLGSITTNNNSGISIANFSDVEFYRDVYPVLKTVTDYAWVNEPAFHGHAPGKPGDFLRENSLPFYSNPDGANNVYRTAVFNFIREAEQLTPLVPPPPARIPNPTNKTVQGIPPSIPDGGVQTGTLMPHLFGEGGSPLENGFNGTNFPNQWLSLTPQQLWKFQEWVNGNFTAGTKPVTPHVQKSFYDIPLADQPAALNFSALEPTVGGGFHPGIELTYYMKEPGFFAEAFRFADIITHNGQDIQPITPGSVAGYMSIPWQGDFWSCNISWWAAMRPDIVIPKDTPPPFIPWFRGEAVGIPPNADNIDGYEGGYEHMVRYWSDFGFVVPTGETDQGMFVMEETERSPCLDDSSAPCVPYNVPEPVHLGESQPLKDSTGPFKDGKHLFYTNTVAVILPKAGSIILSSTSDGTGDIKVDNALEISVNGNVVYTNDYGDPPKATAPVNLDNELKNYRGVIVDVTISYYDRGPLQQGNKTEATNFWLTFDF